MEITNLCSIPNEIIEQILGCKKLSFVDVCNFGSVSSRYWELVNKSNLIWRTKFKQMWPGFVAHDCYKHRVVKDWKAEFCQRLLIGRQTMALVEGMSPLHIRHEELSNTDFTMFEKACTDCEHELAIYFMIDELMFCIHDSDGKLINQLYANYLRKKLESSTSKVVPAPSPVLMDDPVLDEVTPESTVQGDLQDIKTWSVNLTNKYYSEKILRHLRQVHLAKKWEEFKNAPLEEQILEIGAVIVAQWSQPMEEISFEAIKTQLDDIAAKVFAAIQKEYGDKHPACCVPSELRTSWRSRNITDNYYTPYVSRQVIEMVSKVLFKDLGYHGNSDLYYCHENSYINKVLQYCRGIPITLSILYESITRRLGIKCEPVSFPGHFLLRWRDTYKESVPTQYFYIDVFNGGVFLGKDSCPQFTSVPGRCPMGDIFRYGPATPVQVVERMANNLEVAGRQRNGMNGRSTRLRSALELLHMVNPTNLHCMLQLARFYMQYNMDVSSLRQTIQRVTHFDVRDMGQASYILRTLRDYDDNYCQHLRESTQGLEIKRRDLGLDANNVEFAVGMIMKHQRFNYDCVIIGWDTECVASEEWKNQMNVRSLSRQDRQPFYHVLVNDGTNRYAAEENLVIEREDLNCWINHCDIGRYFDNFFGTHYHMNKEMLRAYPHDPLVIEKKFNLK